MATDFETYNLNHTMLRIKDPARSLKFYEFLGMKLLHKAAMPDAKFDLYFLAYHSQNPAGEEAHQSDRQGVLELTHNYGTENDDGFKVNNGNVEPYKGFSRIALAVDALQASCKRIENAGYKLERKLSPDTQTAIALDPDGYWVELLSADSKAGTDNVGETDPSKYRFNNTMLRVKDGPASIKFYQDTMGMRLLQSKESTDKKSTSYFLGYPKSSGSTTSDTTADKEGLLQLVWTHGTEKEADFKYHNGNDEPQGFGHIAITVGDIAATCERFEQHHVQWKKRMTDGRMKNIAFLLDPDNYWIEVVENPRLKDEKKL